MTTEQFGEDSMTFWFSAHGEFLESASKMNEVWCIINFGNLG